MTRPYFECPSYYCDCSKPKYRQLKPGNCPFCGKELIKCDYKTDKFIQDDECSKCGNGELMIVKHPEIKRKIEPLLEKPLKEIQNKIDSDYFSKLNDKGLPTSTIQKGELSGTTSKDECSQSAAPSKSEQAINNLKKHFNIG